MVPSAKVSKSGRYLSAGIY